MPATLPPGSRHNGFTDTYGQTFGDIYETCNFNRHFLTMLTSTCSVVVCKPHWQRININSVPSRFLKLFKTDGIHHIPKIAAERTKTRRKRYCTVPKGKGYITKHTQKINTKQACRTIREPRFLVARHLQTNPNSIILVAVVIRGMNNTIRAHNQEPRNRPLTSSDVQTCSETRTPGTSSFLPERINLGFDPVYP